MRFGVNLPNFGYFYDPRLMADLAYDAEQAGWDGFFVWDHLRIPFYPAPVADPWIQMTAVALRTERIKIGPMITPLSRRRPWKLARETVTLDHLSQGRLIMGVGLGYFVKEEFEAFGETSPAVQRAEILDESLDILVGLWSGQPFRYEGKHFHIQETQFFPAALQAPRIPVWVAGTWPKKAPFRRAARWEGVIPILDEERPLKADEVRGMVKLIRENRISKLPFDVVISGASSGAADGKDADLICPLAEAGATWWLDSFEPWKFDLEATRRRIRLGPPKI
ncbi:MAG: LLM class flavin-dependent oxidoreductase [Chloroflexi bacterium]|nr:LLM class flavin-dependent oxidoreductase [Chloroflexota bacterium]